MVIYKIQWKHSAVKELKRIDKVNRIAIIESVQSLSSNPRKVGVKKLIGSERTFRLRVRNYRVVFEILDDILLIDIIRVKHRKDVYKKL